MKTLIQLSLLGILSLLSFSSFGQTCDTLVLQSGKTMLVQEIQELGTTISYEKCGQEDDIAIFSVSARQSLWLRAKVPVGLTLPPDGLTDL